VVENVFGITSSVSRVPLLQPEKAKLIVMAIAHHNFLRRSTHSGDVYIPSGTSDHGVDGKLVEGSWRYLNNGNSALFPIRNMPWRFSAYAMEVRDGDCKILPE
jgi:hypothetical protein